MKKKNIWIIFSVITIITTCFLNIDLKENATKTKVTIEKKYEYQVNNSGETYGSAINSTSIQDDPDLILVETEKGELGYVYKNDFYDTYNQPKNPEEAVAYMKKLKKNGDKSIPVYKSDGKTIIGSYTLKVN